MYTNIQKYNLYSFQVDTVKLKNRMNGELSLTMIPSYSEGNSNDIKPTVISNQDLMQGINKEYTLYYKLFVIHESFFSDVKSDSKISIEFQLSQSIKIGQKSSKRTMDTIKSFIGTLKKKAASLLPTEGNILFLSGLLEIKFDSKSLTFYPQQFKESISLVSNEMPDIFAIIDIYYTATYFPHFDRQKVQLLFNYSNA